LCNFQGAESILTPSKLSFRFQQQQQQTGDRTEEAQDHIDESYGGGGGGGGGHHAASDEYMALEEFASPFKQLSMLNAAKEMADLLPEVTPSRKNGNAHGDDDVRNENQVLHQNCYDPEVARVAMMQQLQGDKHSSSSSSSSSQVAVTSQTAHEVYGRESATAKLLQPQAFCVLRKSKRVSNRRSEEKGSNNKTGEIVRKAVIDVLAHTDNMGDALSRASHALGDEYSLWNQASTKMYETHPLNHKFRFAG
jgi:hypothetical protein